MSRRQHRAHDIGQRARTSDVLQGAGEAPGPAGALTFSTLLLSPTLLRGLEDAGFQRPSPIQLRVIPLGRCGLDIVAQAKAGTGKTCVFAVIALEAVSAKHTAPQALILAPTREIAVQISDVVNTIGAHTGVSCHAFIGGAADNREQERAARTQVVVGTPGKIGELLEKGVLRPEAVRLFVLDEADKLLGPDFQPQINGIYARLPERKQMLAFSATYPKAVVEALNAYMNEPTRVRLNSDNVSLAGVAQFQSVVRPSSGQTERGAKMAVLLSLLDRLAFRQCVVFCSRIPDAQQAHGALVAEGWPADCITSSQSQPQRLQAMSRLKGFKIRVLVSTDLTARGIDVERVNLVVNLDPPRDAETYLHRIGRTGRFGTKGVAVTLLAEEDAAAFADLLGVCNTTAADLPDHIPPELYAEDLAASASAVHGETVTEGPLTVPAADPEPEPAAPKRRRKRKKKRQPQVQEPTPAPLAQTPTAHTAGQTPAPAAVATAVLGANYDTNHQHPPDDARPEDVLTNVSLSDEETASVLTAPPRVTKAGCRRRAEALFGVPPTRVRAVTLPARDVQAQLCEWHWQRSRALELGLAWRAHRPQTAATAERAWAMDSECHRLDAVIRAHCRRLTVPAALGPWGVP